MAPADSLPSSGDIAKEYIMWTGLGYAPLACILPVRISADGVDKALQGQGANNHAPLADKAQNERKCLFFKDKVNKKGKGKRMVNLARLRQLMAPIKNAITVSTSNIKGAEPTSTPLLLCATEVFSLPGGRLFSFILLRHCFWWIAAVVFLGLALICVGFAVDLRLVVAGLMVWCFSCLCWWLSAAFIICFRR